MKILKAIDKIPGGIVLVPMLVTAVIHTFIPQALEIGGMTTALFSAEPTACFIGILLFLAGSQLRGKDIPAMLGRGGVLTLAKLVIAFLLTWLFIKLLPGGSILGISALAFCVVVSSFNPGTFLAVVMEHGDESDPAGFAIYNLIVVPAVPALLLGFADGTNIGWMEMITTLIPFFLGFVLGNLDSDMRMVFSTMARPVLFFAGFAFGASVDLYAAFQSGVSGIILSGFYAVVVTGLFFAVDRFVLRQPGYASLSLSSVSPASVSMPAMIAVSLPCYESEAAAATAQVATAVIFTTITSVLLTKLILSRTESKKST